MKQTLVPLVLLISCGLMVAPVVAEEIDPPIYVCTGCTSPPGGDPNLIDPASINIGFAGNHLAVSPLLVIVGVPNAGSAPMILLPNGVNPAAAFTYYGLNNATSGNLTGVFEGSLTSTSADAYTMSGLNTGSGGGPSNNWVNWDGFNSSLGINDGSSFSLYAYAIDFALDSGGNGNSPITIGFQGLNVGSIVIAYNCAAAGSTCSGGDIGATPFTNAGDASRDPVPEPMSMLLFGSGLLAVGCIRKRVRA